ncbi:hypothetical protein AB0C02_29605 [Micromonospora sp. NPDC048999]
MTVTAARTVVAAAPVRGSVVAAGVTAPLPALGAVLVTTGAIPALRS